MIKTDIELDIIACLQHFTELCVESDKVKKIILDPSNIHPDPIFLGMQHWSDLNFVEGYPSLLIFYATLNELSVDRKWDQVVHNYVLKIKESLESFGIIKSSSMYGGLAGVCFAIYLASCNETRYMRLLNKIEIVLLTQVEKDYLIPLKEKLKNGDPCPPELYELIQGLAGIGLYALKRRNDSTMNNLIHEIIHLLNKVTQPISVRGAQVPGWYVPQESLFLQEDRNCYPQGNFNMGLAHGITGVLSFLSIAKLNGVEVDGQMEAIESICLWLQSKRQNLNGLFFWKGHISFEDEINHTMIQDSNIYNRDGWCYGTPGVARSLYLAGKALNRHDIKQFALDSFCSLFHRPLETLLLTGPIICHGMAGLLLITHFMFQDSQDLFLQTQIKRLKNILWSSYNSKSCFGFCDYLPNNKGEYIETQKAGLLEGAAGVWLTLLTTQYQSILPWFFPFSVNDV